MVRPMGMIGGRLAYRILKRISGDGDTGYMDGSVYIGRSKLEVLLGPQFWSDIGGKVVIDFGCGEGLQSVEMAQRGAARVIGVDTYAPVLEKARANAARFGVADRCMFTSE